MISFDSLTSDTNLVSSLNFEVPVCDLSCRETCLALCTNHHKCCMSLEPKSIVHNIQQYVSLDRFLNDCYCFLLNVIFYLMSYLTLMTLILKTLSTLYK